jgi:predicted transcriptional regulator
MPDRQAFQDLMLVENPEFENVMRCVFGIGERETRTYLALLDESRATAAELADALDRDRSNVSRSLSALRDKGLLERHRQLLDDGGHVYYYEPESLPDVQALMHDELEEWAAFVHDTIDSFGPPDG